MGNIHHKARRLKRPAHLRTPAPVRVPAKRFPHPLPSRLEQVREQERSAMSRRVHDELGQIVTALDWEIAWLSDRLAPMPESEYADVAEKLDSMSELIGTLTQAIRTVAAELRPRVLDQFGLLAAIEWQGREFASRYRIPCKVSARSEPIALDPRVATAVFRIFQEILTNVARHARATKVRVHLEESPGHLALVVEDNGRGFAARGLRESLGILGMRERATQLGGLVAIASIPGKGTTVTARIPTAVNRRGHSSQEAALPISLDESILCRTKKAARSLGTHRAH